MKRLFPFIASILIGGALIVGCDSASLSDASDQLTSESSSLAKTDPVPIDPAEIPYTLEPGKFTVCKEASQDGTVGFDFATTAVGERFDAGFSAVVTSATLKDGECEDVYTVLPGGGDVLGADLVTVEESVPQMWQLDVVDVYSVDRNTDGTYSYTFHTEDVATLQGTFDGFKAGCLAVYKNSKVPQDFRGCTPGFWKNNLDKKDGVAWPDEIFSAPVDGYVTTLDDLGFDGFGVCDGDDTTMSDALNCGGNSGGQEALMRHAVAALLNASHPLGSYNLSPEGVVAAVNAALASGDSSVIESQKNELDDWNNQGCFVDQHGRLKIEDD